MGLPNVSLIGPYLFVIARFGVMRRLTMALGDGLMVLRSLLVMMVHAS